MTSPKLIYVAHKFAGVQANADRAERLTALLNLHINGAIFICPWLPLVRYWPDLGETRERGLQLGLSCVRMCHAVLALTEAVGGVKLELEAMHPLRRYELSGELFECEVDYPDVFALQIRILQRAVDGMGNYLLEWPETPDSQ
jgi:hypothetical protein